MENIELDNLQLETLITALTFINIEEVFAHDIKIIDYNPTASDDSTVGIQCQVYLIKEEVEYEYLVFIGYYNDSLKRNPESIAVWQIIGDELVLQPIGNLGYVTDRLREYKVWQRS